MARPETADIQELDEIASYHEDATEALSRYFAAWDAIDNSRYLGMTRSELSQVFQSRIIETELRSILQLLASVEAALRVDYLHRCKRRKRDSLSRAFRDTYRQKAEHARLDEDILELWVSHHAEFKSMIGHLRGALHLRHWLAHGRYWRPSNWVRYSYVEIEALATVFLRDFPLFS